MGAKSYLVLQYDSDFPNVPVFVPLTASIVAGLVRAMRETTTSDTLTASDGGLIVKTGGTTQTLEGYSAAQAGNQYAIKNAASTSIVIATVSGEFIQTAAGNVITYTLLPDYALTIIRNATTTANWIIQ